MKLLFDGDQELTDAEQAHDRDDEVHSLHQLVDTHGEAHAAGDGVDADGGDRKTDRERHDRLDRRGAAHADETCEGKEIDRKIFRRSEGERDLCHP